MSIAFTPQDWQRIRDTYSAWWDGTLTRPLINVSVSGYERERPQPELPRLRRTAFYADSVPAEDIVDRIDWDLSGCRFPGDSFPQWWVDYGPGVGAVFLGGRAEQDENTVWFHPSEERELADTDLTFSTDSPWFQRICDLYRAGIERWQGNVQLGMSDLGGGLDLVSTFRPGEQLLFDLYDCPEEVKRVTWQVHEAWFEMFGALNEILQPVNPGYTCWTPIFSAEPYYMLQCDFCYMIGPDMFRDFVRPELAASCQRLTNPFYHLDGPGELPHLDLLLEIPELKGVQWVPGAGAPPITEWPDVYRRIRAAGKRVQIFIEAGVGLRTLDILVDQLGSAEGIILIGGVGRDREDELNELIEKYA
jgi:5-methyltetrahydrofolate--homocysteine methyltransferase